MPFLSTSGTETGTHTFTSQALDPQIHLQQRQVPTASFSMLTDTRTKRLSNFPDVRQLTVNNSPLR